MRYHFAHHCSDPSGTKAQFMSRLVTFIVVIMLICASPYIGIAGGIDLPQPSPFTIIPFDNPTVSLHSSAGNLIVNNNGRVEVRLFGGMQPLTDLIVDIYPAIINIVGQWSTGGDRTGRITTDLNGFGAIELQPGYYALRLDEYFGRIYGLYGINVKSNEYGSTGYGDISADTSMITLNLRPGEVVMVTISLAKLVVGVTSVDGQSVLEGKNAYVYPETLDIAGNPIPVSDYYGSNGKETSAAGTCDWFLAEGTYTIRVENFPDSDIYIYGVNVSAGETKQVIARYEK